MANFFVIGLPQEDLHFFSDGSVKVFQIIDTGVGIAQENITKLFEAFEQVGDRSKQSEGTEGTGLGLAISQRIIQLMGGKIQLSRRD